VLFRSVKEQDAVVRPGTEVAMRGKEQVQVVAKLLPDIPKAGGKDSDLLLHRKREPTRV
jgi:hypothetical protein